MSDVAKQPSPSPVTQPAQDTSEASYEWSTMRVVEGVTTNVASALIIGVGGLIIAVIYALIAVVASALHAPGGLLGLISLLVLGGILVLVIVIIVIWSLIRKASPLIVGGMLLGALVGAAIAVAIEQKGGLAAMVAKHAPQAEQQDQKERKDGSSDPQK